MQGNKWIQSIIGKVQGYIDEAKQKAIEAGQDASFLDLKEGILMPSFLKKEDKTSIMNEDSLGKGGVNLTSQFKRDYQNAFQLFTKISAARTILDKYASVQ